MMHDQKNIKFPYILFGLCNLVVIFTKWLKILRKSLKSCILISVNVTEESFQPTGREGRY